MRTATPFPKGTDATSWLVYSVDWAKDGFVFKVDEQTVYRVTRKMVEEHGKWAFDNPKFVILNLALGGNYPFAVNKAATPYKGLTDSTVQAIKDFVFVLTKYGPPGITASPRSSVAESSRAGSSPEAEPLRSPFGERVSCGTP